MSRSAAGARDDAGLLAYQALLRSPILGGVDVRGAATGDRPPAGEAAAPSPAEAKKPHAAAGQVRRFADDGSQPAGDVAAPSPAETKEPHAAAGRVRRFAGDDRRTPGEAAAPSPAAAKEPRAAAVLVAVSRPGASGQSDVVLTVRADSLRQHPGQVSLPGGTREARDDSLVATALREAEEEIGLRAADVEVIGQLGHWHTPSGFRVTPVIGLIDRGLPLSPCPAEVAAIFHLPLEQVLDPAAYRRAEVSYRGRPRPVLELCHGDYRVWGLTAAILHQLARLAAAP